MKNQILNLRNQGKTYSEISNILGCSKSLICYYCNESQKDKNNKRQQKYRNKRHPYISKTNHFQDNRNRNKKIYKYLRGARKMITDKISDFCNRNDGEQKHFTYDDVIQKYGENPKCYITGELINIYEPKTYSFDHIKPASRGGDNSIDNLGICTKQANAAKSDMTPEELIEFCKKVLTNNGYSCDKI